MRKAEEAAALAKQAAETMQAEAFDQAAAAATVAETAATQAAAPAAELSRTYGSLGSTTSLRTSYKFEPAQSDLMELAKAVVAGNAPLEFLAFNETRINFAVRSEKLREAPGLAIIKVEKV